MKILIVEDDRDVAANLSEFLEPRGHIADFAYDGREAVRLATTEHFDVVVMDIGLPRLDGVAAITHIRNQGSDVPILVLTALDALDDKARAFDVGADDYLVKPFELPELEMRIGALARRRFGQTQVLVCGTLTFNTGTRVATKRGETVRLNRIQQTALAHLMRASPNLVTKEALAVALWGEEPRSGDALRTLIFELRRAIDKPFNTNTIHTEHGQGYAIRDE